MTELIPPLINEEPLKEEDRVAFFEEGTGQFGIGWISQIQGDEENPQPTCVIQGIDGETQKKPYDLKKIPRDKEKSAEILEYLRRQGVLEVLQTKVRTRRRVNLAGAYLGAGTPAPSSTGVFLVEGQYREKGAPNRFLTVVRTTPWSGWENLKKGLLYKYPNGFDEVPKALNPHRFQRFAHYEVFELTEDEAAMVDWEPLRVHSLRSFS